jgi:hypothetical protein
MLHHFRKASFGLVYTEKRNPCVLLCGCFIALLSCCCFAQEATSLYCRFASIGVAIASRLFSKHSSCFSTENVTSVYSCIYGKAELNVTVFCYGYVMAVCLQYSEVNLECLFRDNDGSKGKVIPVHAMKEYGGVNIQLHFLTSHWRNVCG